MSSNPLTNQNYINKDFQTIYPELLELVKKLTYKWDPTISNESDPGVLLIKLNAIIADKNNYNIDKNILECFPDTVTQYDNAYKLYEQLGYNMHWYRSARGELTFNWTSDKQYLNGILIGFKIPQFTMISDSSKEIVYTTLEEVAVNTGGKSATVDAIQGVIRDYTVGGQTLIRPTMLDYKNRLYFPISNVAENGIFISDAVKDSNDNYEFVWSNPDTTANTGWIKVDNLYIQPLTTKCYKFGIDKSNNTCYIEFPSDITDLMGEGIFIKYIQSDGALGNIAAKRMSTFYNDVKATVGSETIDVSGNTKVANYSSITNGLEPETMESAYVNYQKTVGTFDTLVTLRDYLNYIVNDEFEQVSNGVVADRLTDIQSAYEIITDRDGRTFKSPIVSTDDNVPQMTAFDLKTYFLEYSQWPKFESSTTVDEQKQKFKEAYNNSFKFKLSEFNEPLSTSEDIKMLYNNTKSISHDFIQKMPYRPLMIKNKFNLNLTIIPNSIVSQAQADDIEKNIYESLLKQLSSQNLKFGEELTYEKVYDICNNADNRVKAVALDNIEYQPYAVIYLDDFDETQVTISSLYQDEDGSRALNVFRKISNPEEYVCIHTDKGQKLKYGINEIPIFIPTYDTYDSLGEKPDNFFQLSLNEKIALEICAKNILAGITPYYIPDSLFKYELGQSGIDRENNIEYITTHTEIEFDNTSTTDGSYALMNGATDLSESVLLENETLFMYSPSLITDITYNTGVKYVYYTDSSYTGPNASYIPANTNYRLSEGQHLFLFRKEEDTEGSPYLYAKYSKGTILKSTTRLLKYKNERNKSAYENISMLLRSGGYDGEGQILGDLNNKIKDLEDTILGTSQDVEIKKLNSVKLEDDHNYCYWITNDHVTKNSKEYNRLTFEYVSKDGDYVSESFQSGMVYVSNFAWPEHKLSETWELKDEEKIYILKPRTSSVTYNKYIAITTYGETVYSSEVVTEPLTTYEIHKILGPGTRIKCTYKLINGAEIKYNKYKRNDDGDIEYEDDKKVNPKTEEDNLFNGLSAYDNTGTYLKTWTLEPVPDSSQHGISGECFRCVVDPLVAAINNRGSMTLTEGYRIDVINTNETPKFGTEADATKTSTFEYNLKPNEMFIYTDDDKKGLYILEHGTTISLEVPNKDITKTVEVGGVTHASPLTFDVPSMNRDTLVEDGEKAFKDDMWYDFSKLGGKIIGITENQILSMGPGTQLRVRQRALEVPFTEGDATTVQTVYDNTYTNLKITDSGVMICDAPSSEDDLSWNVAPKGSLSNYIIQYKADGDTQFREVEQVEHSDLGWDGYMILNINAGSNLPQRLYSKHNQSFDLYRVYLEPEQENPSTISSSDSTTGDTYIQTSSQINLTGGTNIDTTSINADNETDYLDIFYYKMVDITKDGIITKDEDSYEVTLKNTTNDSSTVTIGVNDGPTIIPARSILSIEFETDSQDITDFRVVAEGTIQGVAFTNTLKPLGIKSDESIVTKDGKLKSGIYYYSPCPSFADSSAGMDVKSLTFSFKSSEENKELVFKIKPLFVYEDISYSNNETISRFLYDEIVKWNVDNKFNFVYVPAEDTKIKEPLKPKSYFESSHKYNKFVIPQISKVEIKTMNKRT